MGTLQELAYDRGLVNDLMVGSQQMQWPGLLVTVDGVIGQKFQAGLEKQPINVRVLLESVFRKAVNRMRFFSSRAETYDDVLKDLAMIWSERWSNVDKPDTLRAIDELLILLEIQAYFSNPQRNPQELYFGGNRSVESLLDFMIWQNQADRLGISLTEENVVKTLTAELGGIDVFDSNTIAGSLRIKFLFLRQTGRDQNRTPERLVKALTEELRVQLARRALLGQENGFRAYRSGTRTTLFGREVCPNVLRSPADPTPDQFFDTYRKERTSVNLAVLDLPVASFLSAVKEEPKYVYLKDLFDKYKGQEPTPTSPTPGFKSPHKARFAWMSVSPTLPYFREQARAYVLAQSVQQLVSPLSMLGSGGGGCAAPAALQVAAFQELQDWSHSLPVSLQAGYARYLKNEKEYHWSSRERALDRPSPLYRDSYLLRPAPLTLGAAQAIAGRLNPTAGIWGNLLPTTGALFGPAALAEQQAEERTAKPLLAAAGLTGLVPEGNGLMLLTAALLHTKIEPAPPYPVMSAQEVALRLLDEESTQYARTLFRTALRTFTEDLTKKKDAAEKEAVVQAFLKKLGVEKTYHVMKTAEDRYALDTDKELQPLKEAYEKDFQLRGQVNFGLFLLEGRGNALYAPDDSLIVPGTLERGGEPSRYVFWKTEDVRAKEPASLEAVRSQVEDAWRWQVAQAKAQARALEIEKELKKEAEKVENPDVLVDWLNEKVGREKKGKVFHLEGVARLIEPKTPSDPRIQTYVAYSPPKEKIEYPPADFASKVLDTLTRKGDAVVLADQPRAHYYVALATARNVPSLDGFLLFVYGRTPTANAFWGENALPENEKAYQQHVLHELRLAAAGAKNVNEQGQILISDDVPKTFDRNTESGD